MDLYENFTNCYLVTKTLRFELKPIAETLEKINENGFIEQDKIRSEDYKIMKKVIDEYHKYFIEKSLAKVKLDTNLLDKYVEFYGKETKTDSEKKAFTKIQADLRKNITESFEGYKELGKKELIKQDLYCFIKTEGFIKAKLPIEGNIENLIEKFKKFTTYFTGYHENRQNMYTHEDKSTGIAFRLINQNLPKFIDNIKAFDKVKHTSVKDSLPKLFEELKNDISGTSITEFCKIEHYSKTVSQKQIDQYNLIIGGKSIDEHTKIKGLNEYINEYNQNQTDKKNKISKLKPLFKQILSDRETASFSFEVFESDTELLHSITAFYAKIEENVLPEDDGLKNILKNIESYNLTGIFIPNNTSLTSISTNVYDSWDAIQNAVKEQLKKDTPQKQKQTAEKYEDAIDKLFNAIERFSLSAINNYMLADDNLAKKPDDDPVKKVETYFADLKDMPVKDSSPVKNQNIFEKIQQCYKTFSSDALCREKLSTETTNSIKKLSQSNPSVEAIKALLDSIKELQFFIKPLISSVSEDFDAEFYNDVERFYGILDDVIPLYNKVRNYLTKKPYSTEKIKLNFENSTLLNGWDVNKESANTSVILRKDGLFYLGIMNKKHNTLFSFENVQSDENSFYEKMEYKLLPGANKMLPKVFFSTSRIDEFNPSKELLEKYAHDTHTKGEKFNLNDCHALIDFFKESITKHEDWKKFEFNFSDTKNYKDLSDFYREVEHQGYKIAFKNISESYINQLVEENKLYLFQIYNKDFSPHSKGTPNLHTLYWRMLFNEDNLKDVVYKLNGQAEIFFRKASISYDEPTHLKNIPINNKNLSATKKTSTFKYDIIKDRRYTIDKFQFHVPITMNFKAMGRTDMNTLMNEEIKKNDDIHIIGIDRGERHLLYVTMINTKGEIKEQYSLNEIINEYNDITYKTNYHDLLNKKEGDRDAARKSWKTIDNIKELKEGYLSQVIHKITKLIIQHNAIVVLEDLNLGFMRGRQKIEKQVYQKFEKMLIDKLNYYADKKKDPNELGGLLHAYQLTDSYADFNKYKKKQCGCLFYIPAWNTSKIDPTTGFVNLFYTKYENIENSKKFFNKFEAITFNADKNYFEFHVSDYSLFNVKATDTKLDWTICTNSTRIQTTKVLNTKRWESSEIVLTDKFNALFKLYNFDFSRDLKEQILNQQEKDFYVELMRLFRLTVQLRNSETGTSVDYLISPVADSSGKFYDSRECDNSLPQDADANGAYNIARKGLWALRQIKEAKDIKKVKLAISNKEWLNFAQKKEYLK